MTDVEFYSSDGLAYVSLLVVLCGIEVRTEAQENPVEPRFIVCVSHQSSRMSSASP